MGFDAEMLQAGHDRALLVILAEVMEMHQSSVACKTMLMPDHALEIVASTCIFLMK